MAQASDADIPSFVNRLLGSRLTWVLLVVTLAVCVEGDIANTISSGSVDLRNRVVGARLLAAGINPYTYFWQSGDPEEYIDPHAVSNTHIANRITVTPAVLACYTTFALRPYGTVKWIWLAIEWLAFLILCATLIFAAPREKRRLVLFTILALWACSDAWRLHIELGQVYVTYALLWSAALILGQCESTSRQMASGLLLGVASVLRPTFVLALVPLGLGRRWRLLGGAVLGGALCVAATWPWADAAIWQSYWSHMEDICRHYVDRSFTPAHWRYPEPAPSGSIEGMTNLAVSRDHGETCDDLHLFATRVLPAEWRVAALKGAFLVFLGWYHWRLARSWETPPPMPMCLLAGAVVAIAADFFIPCNRPIYNNILWAVPVCILISLPQSSELLHHRRGVLLAFGLLTANTVHSVGRYDWGRLSDYFLLIVMVDLSLRAAAAQKAPSSNTA